MKKLIFLLSLVLFTSFSNAQTTSGALKTQIDTDITNKTGASSISKTNVGSNLKAIVDYIVQVISAVEARTVNGQALTGNVTLTKSSINLANVDNTADNAKPVSTAQAAAIAAKANSANPSFTGTVTVNGSSTASTLSTQEDGTLLVGTPGGGIAYDDDYSFFYTARSVPDKAYVDSKKPYKTYAAVLSQSSSGAPTAVVLENTLGGTPTYAYLSTGFYTLTLSGAFTTDKVLILNGPSDGGERVRLTRASANTINIEAFNTGGTAANSVIANHSVEIRVYN